MSAVIDDEQPRKQEEGNPFLFPPEYTDPVEQKNTQVTVLVMVILVLSLGLVALASALIYNTYFNAPKPYVVEIDDVGRASYGGPVFEVTDLTKYTPAQVAGFIENWRTITADNVLQKTNIKNMYCMLNTKTSARSSLNDYFKNPKNNPFELNRSVSQSIQIRTVLKVSDATWTAEWVETVRKHTGSVVGEPTTYKANMTVVPGELASDCYYANPLGIFVKDISWAVIK